jgi:RNA polymerase sigma-70 factor (family 1)
LPHLCLFNNPEEKNKPTVRVFSLLRVLQIVQVQTLEHIDDNNLLDAIKSGDEIAFDTLFRRYYEALCRYAYTLSDQHDLDDAEEVVQQVFVKVWEQRQVLEVNTSLKAYLYKMVYHRCLNRLRDARTREKYHAYHTSQVENMDQSQPMEAQELNERLQKALGVLPTECRRIFELSRFESLKYREIADQLGISIKTVEAQMGKALRILRVELADYLVTLVGWLVGTSFFMQAHFFLNQLVV